MPIALAQLPYEDWLAGATSSRDVDDEPPRGSVGIVPAVYIARAIEDHQTGARRISSGIRSIGLTIVGDLHLEKRESPFSLWVR